MKPSRRGRFGLLAGAASIPFLPKLPEAANVVITPVRETTFTATLEGWLAEQSMPLMRRQLVAYQFGDAVEPGVRYTATRYRRLPLEVF